MRYCGISRMNAAEPDAFMKHYRNSISWLLLTTGWVSISFCSMAESAPKYRNPQVPVEVRVEDLLARLTLEEKIQLCHADSKFTTAAIPRLGIPRRWLSDGPHGVREDVGPDTWAVAGRTDDFATAMPCGIALAATWNPDLARREGEVIGQEARKRGKDIMLGPGLNIMRSPLCGRNFEYFGEDPFLAGRLAVGYINGVQSQGVASCAKHFAVNDQETDRNKVNVEIDERALREIHLPAFKMAVQEAKVWTVMGAYNKLHGVHCCESDYLLNQILKGEWGFQGLVVSDWAGVHNTRGAVLGGLDLEMGTDLGYDDFFMAKAFREGVQKGDVPNGRAG
jgi:beta-glucosidase